MYTLNAKPTSLQQVGQTTGRPQCCAKRFQQVEHTQHIQTCPQGTTAFDGLASLQITYWSLGHGLFAFQTIDLLSQSHSLLFLAALSARVGN